LIVDGLLNARRPVRLHHEGRPHSGRITSIEEGTLTLKPLVGDAIELPFTELSVEELIAGSRVVRAGLARHRAAAYCLTRGDLALADAQLGDSMSEKADLVRDEIAEVRAAMARIAKRSESATASATPAAAPPAPGPAVGPADEALLLHWTFDDDDGKTVRDASGHGRDGTIHGGARTNDPARGWCMRFNGDKAQYVLDADAGSYLNGLTAVTVSMWVKSEKTGTDAGVLATKTPAQGDGPFSIRYDKEGAKGGGTNCIKAAAKTGTTLQKMESASDVQTTSWQHLALVVSPEDGLRLFIDGTPDTPRATEGTPGGALRGVVKLVIGRGSMDRNRSWTGLVDDVRIYARALAPPDVAALAGGAADPSLALHLTFDEGEGTTAKNASSTAGPDATLEGDPAWVDGHRGKALRFRAGSHVRVPHDDGLEPDEFTLSAWFLADELKTGAEERDWIVAKNANGGKQGHYAVCTFEGKISAFIRTNGEGTVSGPELETGRWYHAALAFRQGMMRLYLDGAEVAHRQLSTKRRPGTGDLVVGMRPDGATRFKGVVDDVRLYRRVLEASDVAALAGGKPIAPRAVASRTPAKPAGPAAPPPPPEDWPKEPLPGETGEPGEWAPGLLLRIFDRSKPGTCLAARIDSYPAGSARPDYGLKTKSLRYEWTGYLLVPHGGKHVFGIEAKEYAKVVLNGKEILALAKGKSKITSPEVMIDAGLHPITFTTPGPTSRLRLRWLTPHVTDRTISGGYFFHEVPEPGTAGPPAKAVRGLKAEYFAGMRFDKLVATSHVTWPNLDLGRRPPVSTCPPDGFSIRLSGLLLVEKTGEYAFRIAADDGAKLTVGGQTVIEHWNKGTGEAHEATAELAAGYQPIVIEYLDIKGDAQWHIEWKRPEKWRKLEDIPSGNLFCEPLAPAIVSRKGLAPGLEGSLFAAEQPGGRPAARRYDSEFAHDWDTDAPGDNVPKDKFSGVWKGTLIVPKSGPYMFRVYRSGGVRVTVNRRPIANKWSNAEGYLDSAVPLRAGRVPIAIMYTHRSGKAALKISWAGPSFGFRRLSGGDLAHPARTLAMAKAWEPVVVALPQPPAVAGGGKPKPPGLIPLPGEEEEKPREKPPEGDLVTNGGFEVVADGQRLPERWNKHNWGPASSRLYARTDRVNAKGGENAIMVRGTGDGSLAGVYTSVKSMPPAKYRLRFWVCADVGETARIHAHLAGQDLQSESVGEDWKQLTFTVEIKDEKVSNPPLRLWTSTTGVKVWFDDVEVEAIGQ